LHKEQNFPDWITLVFHHWCCPQRRSISYDIRRTKYRVPQCCL